MKYGKVGQYVFQCPLFLQAYIEVACIRDGVVGIDTVIFDVFR